MADGNPVAETSVNLPVNHYLKQFRNFLGQKVPRLKQDNRLGARVHVSFGGIALSGPASRGFFANPAAPRQRRINPLSPLTRA